MAKRKKRKKIILPKVQTTFCILSIVFILGCAFFYGTRLYKFYKIYNPKNDKGEVLLNFPSKLIREVDTVENGDGLYEVNGNYIYKGKNVNNYILIGNVLFRIMRINGDKTLDLVMDEFLNKTKWNDEITTYDNSSINKYLEKNVLPIINNKIITKTSYCSDSIYELSEVTCEKINSDLSIRILGISDYLNSLNDDKTYIDGDYSWLYNSGKNNVWHTTNNYISNSNPSNIFGVKPVITLKNSVVYLNGDGTKENPYIIEKNTQELKVGSYLDINDNIYIIYEVGDNYLKVQSNKVLKEKMIFDKTTNEYNNSSIKKYLENTYIDKLKINNFLQEVDFNGTKSKIGMLTNDDLKFNSELNNYYLINKEDDDVVIYNGSVLKSEPSTKRNIRYALGIKKDLKIVSGNGSKYAPFIVEVK